MNPNAPPPPPHQPFQSFIPQPPSAPAVGFPFRTHFRRALGMAPSPSDVLPEEAIALQAVASPQLWALLTWRRSILFVAALFLVPAIIIQIVRLAVNAAGSHAYLVAAESLGVMAGISLVIVTWIGYRSWARWAFSGRILRVTWLIYFLVPFVAWFMPLRALVGGQSPGQAVLTGLGGALASLLALAPRVLSLMPALLRAGILAKVLFPGAASPGWVVALAAPMYALLLYLILLIPHQLLGSVSMAFAIAALVGAPLFMWRMGRRIARPQTAEQAMEMIRTGRLVYVALIVVGMLFFIGGIAEAGGTIDFLDTFSTFLQLFANVLVLSVVGADAFLRSMTAAYRSSATPEAHALTQQHYGALWSFVSAEDADTHRG